MTAVSTTRALPNLFLTLGFVFCLGCTETIDNSTPQTHSRKITFADQLKTNQNGWVSSGGNLFREDKNPWFLNNTDKIQYCIEYSASELSVDIDFIDQELAAAFDYWKNQFQRLNSQHIDQKGLIPLGTQETQEVSCSGKEDIQFVFGAQSLSPEQKEFLGDPRAILGTSVRTEYDPVHLRGRGFIFVASDIGAQRYKKLDLPGSPLWSNPLALRAMLAHELGHIYGIRHEGEGLMSESFAERLTSPLGFLLMHNTQNELPSYLVPPEVSRSCFNSKETLEYFGVFVSEESAAFPQGFIPETCIEMVMETPNTSPTEYGGRWQLYHVNESIDVREKLGSISASLTSYPWPMDVTARSASVVYLTPEQKVFAPEDLISVHVPESSEENSQDYTFQFLSTGSILEYSLPGKLLFNDGRETGIYLTVAPEGYKIIAVDKGSQKLVFNSKGLPFF